MQKVCWVYAVWIWDELDGRKQISLSNFKMQTNVADVAATKKIEEQQFVQSAQAVMKVICKSCLYERGRKTKSGKLQKKGGESSQNGIKLRGSVNQVWKSI